ncbi:hypothetical protein F511_42630 [Dorcoceras hygrometricum]|uniref:Cyclin C-terminal domain-containing protein n=1 Tax=Dorcoceras hygrometricum TaxID=472368 RepID=A0A2Z7A0B0_9LAMI|nr:hypothetical protein F511_42630 [Dorcoceras hygrometricum]
MSLQCSDCFSDLLCGEDSNIIFYGGEDDSSEYSSDIQPRSPDFQESIAGLLEDERDITGTNIDNNQSIDASVRTEFVAWIIKVHRYYGFQPLTAFLSVSYFDRFLHSHQLPILNGWPLQLLSTACVEGAKFIFEPRNIQRMELLVLRVLEWRLRSISPFCYLSFFALKIDPTETYTGFLISTAKETILSTIQETSFLEFRPSCIATAAMLYAANDLPKFSSFTAQHAQSWCDGLHKEKITSCYQLMRQIMSNKTKKQPKVLPQLRVMPRVSTFSSDSSSSTSSSFSAHKRRKLNNSSWADDDKGSSD